MVRLQPGWDCRFADGGHPFQFHDGTITTLSSIIYPSWTSRVSIPRWYDYNGAGYSLLSFYTTVSIPRWYDYNTGCLIGEAGRIWCFNSTMVRLQPDYTLAFDKNGYGFNSTMVRLQLDLIKKLSWIYPGFNSTMVRLQLNMSLTTLRGWMCFNSTMVRLQRTCKMWVSRI